MQFAGMNRAKYLQCGGTKCITYSCVYPNITVAGPLLTEETFLILYVLRTCPVRIRFGKKRELPI